MTTISSASRSSQTLAALFERVFQKADPSLLSGQVMGMYCAWRFGRNQLKRAVGRALYEHE